LFFVIKGEIVLSLEELSFISENGGYHEDVVD
jgi:hypothetical protein